jgi:hypothetical protein
MNHKQHEQLKTRRETRTTPSYSPIRTPNSSLAHELDDLRSFQISRGPAITPRPRRDDVAGYDRRQLLGDPRSAA